MQNNTGRPAILLRVTYTESPKTSLGVIGMATIESMVAQNQH